MKFIEEKKDGVYIDPSVPFRKNKWKILLIVVLIAIASYLFPPVWLAVKVILLIVVIICGVGIMAVAMLT